MQTQSNHQNQSKACRDAVEAAMNEIIDRLERRGMLRAEIALTLADAAEDYVIDLAHRLDGEDAGETQH